MEGLCHVQAGVGPWNRSYQLPFAGAIDYRCEAFHAPSSPCQDVPVSPFYHIKCQATAVETLERALHTQRVASAYLFEGPSGVGKTALAMAFAKALVAPVPTSAEQGTAAAEEDAPRGSRLNIDRQRIDQGNHPDVRVFRPRDEGHRNLAVDTIREEVLPFAQYAPFESKHAVLVFPEADVSFPEQHPEAANAMLKTLEEPKAGVHFVLLADRPERLLRTIRSRCQSVRFGRLAEPVLAELLDDAGVPKEGRAVALALADGRADRALALMEDGLGASLLAEAENLKALVEKRRAGEMVNASEQLSKHPHLELLLEALTLTYRGETLRACGLNPDGLARSGARQVDPGSHTATPSEAPDSTLAPNPGTSFDSFSVRRMTAGILRIRQCVDSFEWNANRTSALDAMLYDLSALS